MTETQDKTEKSIINQNIEEAKKIELVSLKADVLDQTTLRAHLFLYRAII